MLNSFSDIQSAYSAVDNGNKSEINSRVTNDGSNYYHHPVAELSTSHQQTDVSGHASTWNYTPYFSGFYNYYPNNPPSYELSNISQCEGQKCVTQCPQGLNQSQLHSAPLVHCCDPRCQLLPDHSKFPVNTPFTFPSNKSRRKTKSTFNNEISPIKTQDCDSKCLSYVPSFQNDLNAKYNNSHASNFPFYQNVVRHPKHQIYPSETSVNDYYPNISKPPYWNRHSTWNNNVQTNASYYPASEHARQYNQKMPLSFQPHASSDYTNNVSNHNKQGILLNRLLDNHEKPPVYENGYDTQNYYTHGRQYSYGYGDNNIPEFKTYNKDVLPPPYPDSHHTDHVANNLFHPYVDVHCPSTNSFEPNTYLKISDTNKESDVKQHEGNTDLNKNQNLDVREFLSTWDDVEDDKVDNNNVSAPVIVLDCTALEENNLDKAKENLVQNIHNSTPCSSSINAIGNNEYNSPTLSNTTSVIENTNKLQNSNVGNGENIFPNVIENNSKDYGKGNSYVAKGKDESLNVSQCKQRPNSPSHLSSNHINNESWRSETKRKEDVPYDLVEMTERLVTTVDRLFNPANNNDKNKTTEYSNVQNKKPDASSSTSTYYEKADSSSFTNKDDKNRTQDGYFGDRLNINLNYKRIQNMSQISEIDIALNKTNNFDIENKPELSNLKPQDATKKMFCDKLKNHDFRTFNDAVNDLSFSSNIPCLLPTDKKLHSDVDMEPIQKFNSDYEDMSCNLNVQRTNNEIKNLYSFSVNYCKKATELNKSDNYSLQYSEHDDNSIKNHDEITNKCNISFDKAIYSKQNKYPSFDSNVENRFSDFSANTEKCEENKRYEYYKNLGNNSTDDLFLHHSNDYFNTMHKPTLPKNVNFDDNNEWYNPSTYKNQNLSSLNEKLSAHNDKSDINISPATKSFSTTMESEINITPKNNMSLSNIIQQNENDISLYGKSLLEIGKLKGPETAHTRDEKVLHNELNFSYLTTPSSNGLCMTQPSHDTVIQKVNCLTNTVSKNKSLTNYEKATLLDKSNINEEFSLAPSKHPSKVNQLETQSHFNKLQNMSLSLNDVYENDTIFDTSSTHFPKAVDGYSEESWIPPKLNGTEHNKESYPYKYNFSDNNDNFGAINSETDIHSNSECSKNAKNVCSSSINMNDNDKQDFDALWAVENSEKNDLYTQPLNLAITKVDSVVSHIEKLSKQKEEPHVTTSLVSETDFFDSSSIYKSNQDVSIIKETKNTDHTIDSIVNKDMSKSCLTFDEEPYFHPEFSVNDNKISNFFNDKYQDLHNKTDNLDHQNVIKSSSDENNNNNETSIQYALTKSNIQHEIGNSVGQYDNQSEEVNLNQNSDYDKNMISSSPSHFIISEEKQVSQINSFHALGKDSTSSNKRKFNDSFFPESKKTKMTGNSQDDFTDLNFNQNNYPEQNTLPGCIVYGNTKVENNQENICHIITELKSNNLENQINGKIPNNKSDILNESSVIVNGSKYLTNNLESKSLETKDNGSEFHEIYYNHTRESIPFNNLDEINSKKNQYYSDNISKPATINRLFTSNCDEISVSNDESYQPKHTEIVLVEALFNGNNTNSTLQEHIKNQNECGEKNNVNINYIGKYDKNSKEVDCKKFDAVSTYNIFSEIPKISNESDESLDISNNKEEANEKINILKSDNVRNISLNDFKNRSLNTFECNAISDEAHKDINSSSNDLHNMYRNECNVRTNDVLLNKSDINIKTTKGNAHNYEKNDKCAEVIMPKNVEVHASLKLKSINNGDFKLSGNDDINDKNVCTINKIQDLRCNTKTVDIYDSTNKLSVNMIIKETTSKCSGIFKKCAEIMDHTLQEECRHVNDENYINVCNDEIHNSDNEELENNFGTNDYNKSLSSHIYEAQFQKEISEVGNNNLVTEEIDINSPKLSPKIDVNERKTTSHVEITITNTNENMEESIDENGSELIQSERKENELNTDMGTNIIENENSDTSDSHTLSKEVLTGNNSRCPNYDSIVTNENKCIIKNDWLNNHSDEEIFNDDSKSSSQFDTQNLNVQTISVNFCSSVDDKLKCTAVSNTYQESRTERDANKLEDKYIPESATFYCSNDEKKHDVNVHCEFSPKNSVSSKNPMHSKENMNSTNTHSFTQSTDILNNIIVSNTYAIKSSEVKSTIEHEKDNNERTNDKLETIHKQSNGKINDRERKPKNDFVKNKCVDSGLGLVNHNFNEPSILTITNKIINSDHSFQNVDICSDDTIETLNGNNEKKVKEISDLHNEICNNFVSENTSISQNLSENIEYIESACELTQSKCHNQNLECEGTVSNTLSLDMNGYNHNEVNIIHTDADNTIKENVSDSDKVTNIENNIINKNIMQSDFVYEGNEGVSTGVQVFDKETSALNSIVTDNKNLVSIENQTIAEQWDESIGEVNSGKYITTLNTLSDENGVHEENVLNYAVKNDVNSNGSENDFIKQDESNEIKISENGINISWESNKDYDEPTGMNSITGNKNVINCDEMINNVIEFKEVYLPQNTVKMRMVNLDYDESHNYQNNKDLTVEITNNIHDQIIPNVIYDEIEKNYSEIIKLGKQPLNITNKDNREKPTDSKDDAAELEANVQNIDIHGPNFTVPRLKYLALDVLSNLTFGRHPVINSTNGSFSRIKVRLTHEKTEITIHPKEKEDKCVKSYDPTVANDNNIVSVNDVDMCQQNVLNTSNFHTLKEKCEQDDGNSSIHCQCLIISSGESVVCLNCSHNPSSIIINQESGHHGYNDFNKNINYVSTNDILNQDETCSVIHSVCDSTTLLSQNNSSAGKVQENENYKTEKISEIDETDYSEFENKPVDSDMHSTSKIDNSGSSINHFSEEHIFIDNVSYNTEVVADDDSLDSDYCKINDTFCDSQKSLFDECGNSDKYEYENSYIPLNDNMTKNYQNFKPDINEKSLYTDIDDSNSVHYNGVERTQNMCSNIENFHKSNLSTYNCNEEKIKLTDCDLSYPNVMNDTVRKPDKIEICQKQQISHSSSVKCNRYSIPHVKVKIPWERMFNLDNIYNNHDACRQVHLKKSIELGPAKIEVHLSPDENGSWKVVNSDNESPAPVSLKVSRLILQRASSSSSSSFSSDNNNNVTNSRALSTKLLTKEDEHCVTTTNSENTDCKSDECNKNVSDSDRLPKIVIKKTSPIKYESYLRMNAKLQPVIRLVRSRSLDEMAAKLNDRKNDSEFKIHYSDNTVETCTKRSAADASLDCPYESKHSHSEGNIPKDVAEFKSSKIAKLPTTLEFNDGTNNGEMEPSCIRSNTYINDVAEITDNRERDGISIGKRNDFNSSFLECEKRKREINDELPDEGELTKVVDVQTLSQERTQHDDDCDVRVHYCILCRRSYPSLKLYQIHRRGNFHRYVELVQRRTIHAVYRHLTGHRCPRLSPLTAEENRRMRCWKPLIKDGSSAANIRYHEKTPLQIALRKGSMLRCKKQSRCKTARRR